MNKSPARSRADIQFASQSRDAQIRDEIARERVRTDAKTTKLKALRLARDEELRIEQERLDALAPPKKAAKKAKS